MYLNLALLAGFIPLYTVFAGHLERSPISGALVFTAHPLATIYSGSATREVGETPGGH